MSLTIFWRIWIPFTFIWPRQRCQSSSAPSPVRTYAKLAASALCTFIKFISYKLCLRDTIAMALLSQAFTKYLLRLNCIFKPFDTNLLTKSKLACNSGSWSASLIKIRLILPLMIASTMMDPILMASTTFLSPKCSLCEVITSYVSNAPLCKVMCLVGPESKLEDNTQYMRLHLNEMETCTYVLKWASWSLKYALSY